MSAIGGVEENAERDATRSAIASSWLRTSGGRRRTHRARQADARGEVGDGLHGLEVRGVHGDGAAAAPAASERAPRRHARGHRGVQLTVATGDRARDVGWRARASGDRGRAGRGAMRDGLHRVTNHSSGEGTRDVDRTNASNGGCARQPAASGISRSDVLVIKIAILRHGFGWLRSSGWKGKSAGLRASTLRPIGPSVQNYDIRLSTFTRAVKAKRVTRRRWYSFVFAVYRAKRRALRLAAHLIRPRRPRRPRRRPRRSAR